MNLKLRFAAMLLGAAAIMQSCSAKSAAGDSNPTPTDSMTTEQKADTASVKVKFATTAGNFTVLLYGDTPKHRDNFIKLAKEGYYNGTLFHRVIKNFMVQAGDPDSRTATAGQALGAGGPEYKIDAEIVFPKHFHKRGALAAARQGDQVNPLKKSSGSQFYIVTGNKLTDADVDNLGKHLQNSRMQSIFNSLAMQHRDSIIAMQQRGDRAGLQALQDKLIAETEAQAAASGVPAVTDEMRQAYTTVGGAPHLDGEYTVFGEIVDGMDVIDKIEQAQTDGRDRPVDDIKILDVKVIPAQ